MKRNMIMIVLDSVTYSVLNTCKGKDTMTPFFQELMNKGIRITNMYSEAPYTEAALVSLQCGINTLDRFGHMKRNKYKNTVFEIYKENGYRVYSNAFQPAIYPSGQMPNVKNKKYNFPFMYSQIWDYRLKYFSEISKNQNLNNNEYDLLFDIMDDNFKAWFTYFDDIINKNKSIDFIYESIENKENIPNSYLELTEEYNKYLKNKKTYLDSLLNMGLEHPLAKISNYMPKKRIQDRTFVALQCKKRKKTINRIFFKNFWLNLKNNRMSFTVVKNYLKAKEFKKLFRYFLNYCNSVVDKDLYQRINAKYDGLKYVPSLNSMLTDSLGWIKSIKKDEKPYFVYIHAEDNHFQETFFSYDSDDDNLLNEEFSLLNENLKKINKNYRGSIAYDLSLAYVDNCLKKYYNQLESEGILDNTDIVITADHGFSYYYNPIREQFVTNYYRETYNIPFIICSKNIKKNGVYEDFYMSKDILPTMLDLSGLKIPKTINGQSVLRFSGRNYSLIEYMGGGCPHYYRRPFKLGVRTREYSVVVEIGLNEKFDDFRFVTCFDLKKDPMELNNLIYKKIDISKIAREISIIRTRYEELKKEILSDGYYRPKK